MGAAHAGEGVHAAPAVAVEHRQRPKLHVLVGDAQMRDQAVGVDGAVAMGEHHALGPGSGAGGVVDGNEVVLAAFHGRRQGFRLIGDERFPVLPTRWRIALVLRDDEVFHRREIRANVLHHLRVFVVRANDLHASVVQDILVVRRHKPVVERHQHRPDLAGGVEALQKEVRVGAQDAHPIAPAHAQAEQRVGEAIHPRLQFPVGEPPSAVDDGGFVWIELRRSAEEEIGRAGASPPRALPVRSRWRGSRSWR